VSEHLWWQHGIIYQIYPRSFMDANGDGVGDLEGIRQRLDYLEWLGVDAIWISPIYPSPMADFGYDVADYTGIHPLFGTMQDFDRLLDETHRRGLKLLLDLVPNHTSSEHPWFQSARSSRDDPKRDWYIWRDPAPDGGPPNNWLAVFGGSAWEFDERTGQYYYHAFLKEQPDLNFRNPDVVQAMLDVMRFWLDKGVDGFRVDVMWHMIKDAEFRDNPPNPRYRPGRDRPYAALKPTYTTDRPEVHDIVARMREVVDAYHERVMIGEIYLPVDKLVQYYGTAGSGTHLPFNFQLVVLPWQAARIFAAVNDYERALPPGGWPNWVLGNHDTPRIATRAGAAQAPVAALLLLTLRGTPTIYYGDEIGMTDVPIPPDRIHDPQGRNIGVNRDPARTPMQWNSRAHAGFSLREPWLPIADDADVLNVDAERDDPASLLSLHRRLIALRRAEPALAIGDYEPVGIHGDAFAFVRSTGGRRLLIAVNLSATPTLLRLPDKLGHGAILVGTDPTRDGASVDGNIELSGNEGIIVALRQD
jgi:alpha-glucosidase